MTISSARTDTGVDGDTLLSVRDLCVHFPVRSGLLGGVSSYVRAVDRVSLNVGRGETLGLVGESGCGKTTLARAILGLIEPARGRVLFEGVDVHAAPRSALRKIRREMQVVFQDPAGSLNPRMTIGRAICEPLTVHRIGSRSERNRAVGELMERVGLRADLADRYPHEFSGGQRQRIGIARALALSPKLIICDEPVSALDVSVRSQILNLLSDLKDDLGLSYLFIAHDLAVVEHFSARVAVMYNGRIVETAGAEDLYATPAHPYTRALFAAVPRVAVDGDANRSAVGFVKPFGYVDPLSTGLTLEGEDAGDPARTTGCTLHLRCPFATERCSLVVPELSAHERLSTGHVVACHEVEHVLTGVPRGNQFSAESTGK